MTRDGSAGDADGNAPPDCTGDGVDRAADGGARRFHRLEEPRGDRTREWELFVRESAGDPLTHAGSVSAPTADLARERATTLFGFAAAALWLCPADETVRVVAEDVALGDRAGEYGPDSGENDAERPAERDGEGTA